MSEEFFYNFLKFREIFEENPVKELSGKPFHTPLSSVDTEDLST